MSTRPLRLAVLAALLVASLALPGGRARAEEPAPVEWLFLVYHDADCNLEEPMMRDLEEMLAVGSGKDVTILALVDRHPNSESPYSGAAVGGIKDWSSTKLVGVEKGRLVELADLGEKDMGDAATLSTFVTDAVKRAPAKHVALVLGDHGAAWPGICSDETDHENILTLAKLETALEASTKALGRPLDLVGFDACLMANLEVASALAPFAHVMVASEELEPGSGWDYTPVLMALEKTPTMGAAELGALIADHFQASFTRPEADEDSDVGVTITLSVTDLTKVEAVAKAAHELGHVAAAHLAKGGRDGFIRLARARSRAEEYGRNGAPGSKGLALHDLVDLARHLAREAKGDEAIGNAAKAVEHAMSEAIGHAVRGKARPDSNGLSIYLPLDGASTDPKYGTVPFSKEPWGAFVSAFGAAADADTSRPDVESHKPEHPELAEGGSVTVTGKIASMDDLDEVRFVLGARSEKGLIVVGLLPEEPADDGSLSRVFGGSWLALEVGDHRVLAAVTGLEPADDEGKSFLAEIPAQVREKGSKAVVDVTLSFLVTRTGDDLSGEFVQAVAFEDEGPREVPLHAGDRLVPVYVYMAEDGTMTPFPSADPADVLTLKNASDVKLGAVRVPAGEWIVGFLATDLSNNTSLSGVPITIK